MLPQIHQADQPHSGLCAGIPFQGMLVHTSLYDENLLQCQITQPLRMGSPQPYYISYETKQKYQNLIVSLVSHHIAALQVDYPFYTY